MHLQTTIINLFTYTNIMENLVKIIDDYYDEFLCLTTKEIAENIIAKRSEWICTKLDNEQLWDKYERAYRDIVLDSFILKNEKEFKEACDKCSEIFEFLDDKGFYELFEDEDQDKIDKITNECIFKFGILPGGLITLEDNFEILKKRDEVLTNASKEIYNGSLGKPKDLKDLPFDENTHEYKISMLSDNYFRIDDTPILIIK